jgi:SAM-dependent methyltransferase
VWHWKPVALSDVLKLSRPRHFSGGYRYRSSKGRGFPPEHWESRPTYEAADFHEWAIPSELFDVVISVDAISCFRDQLFVLRKMAQVLRNDGRVVLTTVNPLVYKRIRRSGGVRLENGPVSHWLTRAELHRLVAEAGLVLERSYTIMPRGNIGVLRVINSRRLNDTLGPAFAAVLRRLKEQTGLGQYRVIIARKQDRS